MIKRFCDICGKEISTNEIVKCLKIKKQIWDFWETPWERIDCHTACWKDLCEYIKILHEVKDND